MLEGVESVAPFITVNKQSEYNPDCNFHSSNASFASVRSHHQNLLLATTVYGQNKPFGFPRTGIVDLSLNDYCKQYRPRPNLIEHCTLSCLTFRVHSVKKCNEHTSNYKYIIFYKNL